MGIVTTLDHTKEQCEPSVRVRLHSDRNPPVVPSVVISQVMDIFQNSADAVRGSRRPRLPSLRSLHVAISGSPVLYEIPLTPVDDHFGKSGKKSSQRLTLHTPVRSGQESQIWSSEESVVIGDMVAGVTAPEQDQNDRQILIKNGSS